VRGGCSRLKKKNDARTGRNKKEKGWEGGAELLEWELEKKGGGGEISGRMQKNRK